MIVELVDDFEWLYLLNKMLENIMFAIACQRDNYEKPHFMQDGAPQNFVFLVRVWL